MEEEQPPEWMLPHDDELVAWFDQVKRNRERRYDSGNDDDDDGTMVSNELAEGRR